MDYALHRDVALDYERATFIRRTYAHLAGAVLVFAGLEWALFESRLAESIVKTVFLRGNLPMLFLMIAFIGVGYLAQSLARSDVSTVVQYVGLGLYIVAEVVIFLPLLYIAVHFSDPSVLPTAGILTLSLFAGLTATVFVTGKDFSFLRPIICIASFVALGVIITALLFNSSLLGLFFSLAMVCLAATCILYNTSNVLHYYRNHQYVAASLDLFASLALLF
jgi:FtsH-binding integral membrane protein